MQRNSFGLRCPVQVFAIDHHVCRAMVIHLNHFAFIKRHGFATACVLPAVHRDGLFGLEAKSDVRKSPDDVQTNLSIEQE